MAPKDKLLVRLTSDQRAQSERTKAAGRHAAAALAHARIRLAADTGSSGPGWAGDAIADALERSAGTAARVRTLSSRRGPGAVVHRKKPTGRRHRELDGARETALVAPPCSTPPGGKARWTLKMLADRLVELEVVDAVSDGRVRRLLKKTR